MKADKLKLVLRAIIKEEVKKAVAEEVNRAMGKVLVEMVREIKQPSLGQQITDARPAAAPIKTKDPKLNSALNETARNYTPLRKTNDSSISMSDLMDGGDFEKIGQNEEEYTPAKPVNDGTKIGFLRSIITENTSVPSVLDKGADVPDILKGVFKRDFRQVMKAIEEKDKSRGAGSIRK
jgi:hypothetical protein